MVALAPPLEILFFSKYVFIYLFIYLAALSLSYIMRDLCCAMQDLQLQHAGSFSCGMWDLVP